MQFTEDTSSLGRPAPVARRPTTAGVAALLREDVEAVAVALLGRQPHSRTRKELRFGGKGGITVGLMGKWKGKFHDYTDGTHGDLLDLARRVHGQDGGLEWAWRRCGDGAASEPDRAALAARTAKRDADRAAADRKADEDAALMRLRARAIWDAALPIRGTQAGRYLATRLGVDESDFPSDDWGLRFAPSLLHSSTKKLLSAMLAAVRAAPGADLNALHRTYLHPDRDCPQKVPVDNAKMLMGRPGAGGVWLTDARPRMFVGEGIETTLSALVAAGSDMNAGAVAALSTGGMRNLVLPDAVREVVILVDVDKPVAKSGMGPGEAAARVLAERMAAEGRTVRLAFPGARDGAKGDFNDLLLRGGRLAVVAAIAKAEVVPDPNVALRERGHERILDAAFVSLEEGNRTPGAVRRMYERPELPADLTLADGEARLAALMRVAVQAAAHAAAPAGIKMVTKARARSDMHALPMRDPRRSPGPERKAYLAERRGVHAREMKAALLGAGWPDDAPSPAPLVVNATMGLGKTEAVMRALAAMLRAAPVPVPVTWLDASYMKADETAARLRAKGVPSRVLRGRNQAGPETGEALCRRAELADQAAKAGLSVHRTVCEREGQACPFRATCGYFKQADDIPDGAVRIGTHDALARGTLPGGVKLTGLVIVDESPLGVLAGEGQMRSGTIEEIRALAKRMDGVWPNVAGVLREAAGLMDLPDLGGAGWRQRLEACRVSQDGLNSAKAQLAEALKAPGDVGRPNDDDLVLRVAVARAGAEARALKQALAVVEALARDWSYPGRDVQSLMALAPEIECGASMARWGAFAAVPALPDGIALIVLDGTGDPDVSRLLFGPAARFETIRVAQHMSVTQIVEPSFSKTALGLARDLHAAATQAEAAGDQDEAKRLGNAARLADNRRRDTLRVLALLGGRHKLGVVTYKALAQTPDWVAAAGEHSFPLAWFGGMRGLDAMADCSAVAVIGRPQPPRLTVEALARVLYANAPAPLTGLVLATAPADDRQFVKVPRALFLRDGDAWGMEVDAHPDPRVDGVLRMVRDAELIQAIGRIRAARADEDNPKKVYLFADVPLPLVVDHVATLDETRHGMAIADAARLAALPLDVPTLTKRAPSVMEGKGGRTLGASSKKERARWARGDVIAKAVAFREAREGGQLLYNIYSHRRTGPLPSVCGFIAKNDNNVHNVLIYDDVPRSLDEFKGAIGRPDVLCWVQDLGVAVAMAKDAQAKADEAWHRASAHWHQVMMSAPNPYRSGWSGLAAWMKEDRDAQRAWLRAWECYVDASPKVERVAIMRRREDHVHNVAKMVRAATADLCVTLLDRLDPFVIETPQGPRLRGALADGWTLQDTLVDAEIFCTWWLELRQHVSADVHDRPFARLFEGFRQMDPAARNDAARGMVHA